MLQREALLAEVLMLVGRHAAPPREPRPPGIERRAVWLAREYLTEHAAEVPVDRSWWQDAAGWATI